MRNIYLIGPMGSGKSAVGRRLANELKLDFIDSDEEIELRTGVDIPFIFDKEGEAGFRQRERAVIADLVKRQGVVLATGGGVPESRRSRRLLEGHGVVVYLYTSVPEQLRRTRQSKNRPLLERDDPETVLTSLLERRDPLYREIADIVVETDGRQVPAVTREIIARLEDSET